jgi:drug/metabolite transporter (DMT)-like permease
MASQPGEVFLSEASRPLALVEGVVTMVLWGSTFVLVKLVLPTLGPLTIAAMRYTVGGLLLLPFMKRPLHTLRDLSLKTWGQLLLLGLFSYTIGNGATFMALQWLSATSISVLINLVPGVVLLGALLWLREVPAPGQVLGVVVGLVGGGVFFSSQRIAVHPLGLALTAIALACFAAFVLLSRKVVLEQAVDTLTLTAVPLLLGGGLLVPVSIAVEGLPPFSPYAWGIVLVMAALNSSFAYVLYNHALKALTAVELSTIINLAPIATALIAWVLLGELLNTFQIAGMLVAIAGVTLVVQGGRGT